MADDREVTIKGSSDTYDQVLNKIIALNAELNSEMSKAKGTLESLNPVYDHLAESTKRYTRALESLKKFTGRRSGSKGSNLLPEGASQDEIKDVEGRLKNMYNRITDTIGKEQVKNFKSLTDGLLSMSSIVKGKFDFSKLMQKGVMDLHTNLGKLSKDSKGLAEGLGEVGEAGAGAEGGLLSLGGAAGPVGIIIVAITGLIVGLATALYKIGENGFKVQESILQTKTAFGSAYPEVMKYAQALKDVYGLSEDRTMMMSADTSNFAKSLGMDTHSGANMGMDATKWSLNFANKTGQKPEDLSSAFTSAFQGSGSQLNAMTGINVTDNMAKMWSLQNKGIDAFNGKVSEATMAYARFMTVQEQVNLMGMENIQNNHDAVATYTDLKSTMNDVGKEFNQAFEPVFRGFMNMLDSMAHGLKDFVGGFKTMMEDVYHFFGVNTDVVQNLGVPQQAIDSANQYAAGLKKTGDQLDALKHQLFGFDEVNSFNPYNPTIPTYGNADKSSLTNKPTPLSDIHIAGLGDPKAKPGPNGLNSPNTVTKHPDPKNPGYSVSEINFPKDKNWWQTDKDIFHKIFGNGDDAGKPSVKTSHPDPKNPGYTVKEINFDQKKTGYEGLKTATKNLWEDNKRELSQVGLNLDNTWIKFWNKVDNSWNDTKNFYNDMGIKLGNAWIKFWNRVDNSWNDTKNFYSDMGIKLGNSWTKFWNRVDNSWKDTKNFYSDMSTKLGSAWGSFWKDVGNSWNDAGNFFGDMGKYLSDTWNSFWKTVSNSWNNMWGSVGDSWNNSGVGKSVNGAVGGAVNGVQNFFGIPHHAHGGFSLSPYLAVVGDAPQGELHVPLGSSRATPAYKGIASELQPLLAGGGGGGGDTYHIHLGEGGTVISGDYSLRMFVEKIANALEVRNRNTGRLNHGT